MSERVLRWEPGMESLGPSVIAIGVFDGVHVGHRELLQFAARDARRLHARSVALTFDRDPDQVVTPEAAAPQLLTLEDKCRFILDAGIERVLVVPFTLELAAMPAERFLDELLLGCCDVRAVNVGSDFRFGARASGNVETLEAWAAEHGADIRAHDLLTVGGKPVTSTRIRTLVSHGDVAEANVLLGRPTRVVGQVHQGRQQGRDLGFPTANVVPVEHAALPGDGVYAGRALLADGSTYPAAISVGVPPSFPEARDYLEAHLIGFDGDLYGQALTLEFIQKLRDQRGFGSLEDLSAAIRADVADAETIAGRPFDAEPPFEINPFTDVADKTMHTVGLDLPPDPEFLEDGSPVVDDPDALEVATAEASVSGFDGRRAATGRPGEVTDATEWVPLVEPRRLSGIFGEAGFTAALVTAPLQAAEIPYQWDPYPPDLMPSFRVGYGAVDRPFSLLVPSERLEEAREVMDLGRFTAQTAPPTSHVLMPPKASRGAADDRTAEATQTGGSQTEPAAPPHDPLKSKSVENARTALRVLVWLVLAATALLYLLERR